MNEHDLLETIDIFLNLSEENYQEAKTCTIARAVGNVSYLNFVTKLFELIDVGRETLGRRT